MAKLSSNFDFIGPLGPISAYKMRGVKGTVLRRKRGASKEKVKNSPKMEGTRMCNKEFGGRSAAGKWVRRILHRQMDMAGYNITGDVNAMMTPFQKLDADTPFGRRNVLISKNPSLLQGFSLNKENVFDSIVRNPLTWSIDREKLSASIEIPALLPGINLRTGDKFPLYRLVATLGVLPDLFYTEPGGKYLPSSPGYQEFFNFTVETDWYVCPKGSPATTLTIQLPELCTPPDQAFSLLLAIGLGYGEMRDANDIRQIKGEGASKILGMA